MNFTWKITYYIFLAGTFVLLSFAALTWQNFNSNFYFFMYLLVVFLLLFGIFTGNLFSRPLKKIIKAADQLADGNLQSRAYVKSNDEFGKLADTLNRLAEQLEQAHIQKEKTHQAVATKVSAIVQPLHETIEALERKAHHRTLEAHKATEFSERLQIDLVFKEAELIDVKDQLAKVIKRKARKPIVEES